MSEKIKRAGILLLFALLLCGCYTRRIPGHYLPGPKDVGFSALGSWILVRPSPLSDSSQPAEVSGELIGIRSDTLFVLTVDSIILIGKGQVAEASLFIFREPMRKYAVLTGLFLVPVVISMIAYPTDPFIIFSFAPLFAGSLSAIFEALSAESRLSYPSVHSLADFLRYSRFPQGIPPGVNLEELRMAGTSQFE